MRHDANVLEEVGVVAMEHRAVVDRTRQVGRHAATRCELEIDAVNASVVVEADVIVDDEIMAFARHDHVVVAVEPQLAGPARSCRPSSAAMQAISAAWLSLPPNAPPMRRQMTTTSLALRRVACATRCLHFVGMLRRAVDKDRRLPAGIAIAIGPRDKTDPGRRARCVAAGDAVRLRAPRRVAAHQRLARQHERLLFHGRQRIENGFEFFVLDVRERAALRAASTVSAATANMAGRRTARDRRRESDRR